MPESTPVFETAEPHPLRIVFEHTKGRLKGLRAIMGLSTDFGGTALPAEAEGFEAHGEVIDFAGLVKVTRNYALYREPMASETEKMFDARQQ